MPPVERDIEGWIAPRARSIRFDPSSTFRVIPAAWRIPSTHADLEKIPVLYNGVPRMAWPMHRRIERLGRGMATANVRAVARHRGLVLVVEDDIEFRTDLCAALEADGYRAAGASDGHDALEWLQTSPVRPSAIVLDLNMEGMDGETLGARLAYDRRYRGIPIVLMSGHADLPAVKAKLDAHAALSKPFLPDTLLRVIGKVCA